MTHRKKATVLLLFLCCFPLAFAMEGDGGLEDARKECSAHIVDLQTNAETWRWIAVVMAVLGGVAASLTGLKAGVSGPNSRRKWGYAALVSGAIAAASPLLPKSDEFQSKLALSDRHYIVGLKVQRQLDSLDPSRPFRGRAAKYAMARFTDCLAGSPEESIPDLPEDVVGAIAMSPGPSDQ